MKRNLVLITAAILVCATIANSVAQGRRQTTPTLTEPAKAALITALAGRDGEYAARAEYEAILAKFGSEVLPYAHIIQAEGNHVAALEQQCRAFGVPIPEDSFFGKVQPPANLAEAAKAGILAEEANVKMYEELLKAVQGYPSLVRVFSQLQSMSRDRHLPALKAADLNGGQVAAGSCNPTKCLRQPQGGSCDRVATDCPQQGSGCQQMGQGPHHKGAGRGRNGQP